MTQAAPTKIAGMSHPHIYLYSPSGAVRDKKAYRLGLKRLQAAGYAVTQDQAA